MTQVKIPPGGHDRLIRHIERVAGKAKNSKLSQNLLTQVEYSLLKVAEFLGCSTTQALMFCVIMDINFSKKTVSVDDIGDFFRCSPLTVARYLKDLEKMEAKRLIRRHWEGKSRKAMLSDICFFVTLDVLDAIYLEDRALVKENRKMTMAEMLGEINQLMEDRENFRLSYEELNEEINDLLNQNRKNDFVVRLRRQSLPENEQALILLLCFEILKGNAEIGLDYACDKIFNDWNAKHNIKRGLVKGTLKITMNSLVKLEDGFFRCDREVMLTDKGLEVFFEEDAEVVVRKESFSNMIMPEKISEKQLFFNSDEQGKLDFLRSSLEEDKFRRIVKKLKEHRMKSGFTVLFYGEPGTGKTESVYQVARATGRGILRVDISETKSMWFGESEKRIKQIFDDYHKIRNQSKLAPILLFNEADGILGKRRELERSAVKQTENAIQNILLQELEDFEGILIATTNLTINLDKAFERRFLYKIMFEKPVVDVRAQIWRCKIPVISKSQATELAGEFDLTGGQIDNIARKFTTEDILNGSRPGIGRIREFCLEETLLGGERRRVGF